MINDKKTMTYRGLALILGSLGLVAVACSDDDDATPSGEAGMAGDDSGGTSSNAGTSSAGKTSDGGKGGGGSGGSAAGTNVGGGAAMAGMGAGGELGLAGMDMGGAPGAAGSGDGGAGGVPVVVVVPDTLDDANFSNYNAGSNWVEAGDGDASDFKWPNGDPRADAEKPSIVMWRATAYKVSVSQVVSPLPNGTYSFSMEVQRAPDLTEQYLFAKGCKAGEPDAQVTQSTSAAGSNGFTKITLANIEVTSGSCTVGIYTDAPDGGWANVDNAAFALQ